MKDNLVLKIAAGVFIGGAALILSVAIVYNAPRWLREQQEASAATVVRSLTPELVIERCGKPTGDKTEDIGVIQFRRLNYPEYTINTGVELEFMKSSDTPWHHTSMKLFGDKVESSTEELRALPCLNK